MKNFIKENKITIVGVLVGIAVGFMYWNYIGCISGTCAITSKPINSSIYGGMMGGLLFSLFQKDKTKK